LLIDGIHQVKPVLIVDIRKINFLWLKELITVTTVVLIWIGI